MKLANPAWLAPCRGWQSTAEGMKLGQDLQSPTPDSSACRPILLMATRNPARKPVEDASLSHYLQGFSTIPGGDRRISEPSTVSKNAIRKDLPVF